MKIFNKIKNLFFPNKESNVTEIEEVWYDPEFDQLNIFTKRCNGTIGFESCADRVVITHSMYIRWISRRIYLGEL